MREAFSIMLRLSLAHLGLAMEAGLAPRQARFTSSAEVRSSLSDGLEPGAFDVGRGLDLVDGVVTAPGSVSSREFLVHGPQFSEASEAHYPSEEQERIDRFAGVVDTGSYVGPNAEVPLRPLGFETERAILTGAWQSFWHDVQEDAFGAKQGSGRVADAAASSWTSPWWWGAYTLVLGSFAVLALRVYQPNSALPVAKRNDAFVNPSRRLGGGPWREPANKRY
jgi:hypothetical protein